MAKNDIGGFFVSLGLNLDKPSFETGNKLIDNVGNSFNKLIGIARNAAVVLAGTAIATGAVESSAYKTAERLGLSTEALDLWRASAKIAGVNADGLIGSMGRLADVLNHIKIDGSGLQEYEKKLGNLKMSINEFQREDGTFIDADKAYAKIIERAQEMTKEAEANLTGNELAAEKLRITTIVGDVLGSEGQNFFIELQRQNKSLDEFLKGAGRTIFTTAADNQNGNNFIVEANTLKTEFESIGKLLGDSIGGEIAPYLQEWNKWIQENKDNIKDAVEAIASVTGKLLGYLNEVTKRVLMNEDQTQDADVLNSTLEGKRTFDFSENGFWKGLGQGLFGDADYKILTDYEKDRVADYYKKYNTLTGLNLKNADIDDIKARAKKQTSNSTSNAPKYDTSRPWYMQDGIMRPDGTVTQVAPDDWVFAARNVGDLAKAFIPQMPMNMAGVGNQEYVINQTFNISGSNDIPQVLKQQAYAGTQEGLLQAMQESSRRMQLMTGMR